MYEFWNFLYENCIFLIFVDIFKFCNICIYSVYRWYVLLGECCRVDERWFFVLFLLVFGGGEDGEMI